MSPRQSQVRLAAAYQLMASYLVWDIHDLLKGGLTDPEARDRLEQFIELLDHALRAAHPAYPAGRPESAREGSARGEQTERLVSRNRDEELMNLIIAARGDSDRERAGSWTAQTHQILSQVEESGWHSPDPSQRQFLKQEVEPFLRRLQRIDQLDDYRPGKRPGLTRR